MYGAKNGAIATLLNQLIKLRAPSRRCARACQKEAKKTKEEEKVEKQPALRFVRVTFDGSAPGQTAVK